MSTHTNTENGTVELFERRKGNGARHAVTGSGPFDALCGRELDGDYWAQGAFCTTFDDPKALGYCVKCHALAYALLWGESA